jgi:hypothetical protein
MWRLFPKGILGIAYEAKRLGISTKDYMQQIMDKHALELEAARLQDICRKSLATNCDANTPTDENTT